MSCVGCDRCHCVPCMLVSTWKPYTCRSATRVGLCSVDPYAWDLHTSVRSVDAQPCMQITLMGAPIMSSLLTS